MMGKMDTVKPADVVARALDQKVSFELPLVNAGKGAIALSEALRRRAQFTDLSQLLLTGAPLFGQKAEIFPNSVFIIGVDTAARLLQPRFYENDPAQMRASFDRIKASGCRFLVAGRVHDDNSFKTLHDLQMPPAYQAMFEQIPEALFRLDVSSTQLRNTMTAKDNK